jgi:hypothetical protein
MPEDLGFQLVSDKLIRHRWLRSLTEEELSEAEGASINPSCSQVGAHSYCGAKRLCQSVA